MLTPQNVFFIHSSSDKTLNMRGYYGTSVMVFKKPSKYKLHFHYSQQHGQPKENCTIPGKNPWAFRME